MRPEGGNRELMILVGAKLILFLVLPAYVFLRIHSILFDPLSPAAWTISIFVFIIELYFISQVCSYLVNLTRAIKDYPKLALSLSKAAPGAQPKAAVLIPIYNEPVDVVEGTVRAAVKMSYPNKTVYLLDDSDEVGLSGEIDALAARNGVEIMRRAGRAGFKAGSLNDVLSKIKCDYAAVLDADQQPEPDFLSTLIPILERDDSLAYVQTPQSHIRDSGADRGFVETAAAAGQRIFYNYVCEGKGVVNAQFSCGSNVVYRMEALRSISRSEGGREIFLDEWCVTEDYATSIRLQEKGWGSQYYTGTFARGLVPMTFEAFISQKRRWAAGTMAAFKRYLPTILFGNLSLKQRCEYAASGTYFLVGIANFLMLVNVVILVLMDAPVFTPLPFLLFFSNLLTFYYSQNIRGNKPLDILYEQMLNFLLFPVFIEALVTAISGKKLIFAVTPKMAMKKAGGRNPGTPDLLIQDATMVFCMPILALGLMKFAATGSYYTLFNLFWLVYSMLLLGAGILLVKRQYSGVTVPAPSPVPRLFGDSPASP